MRKCKKGGCTTDVFIRKDIEHKFLHVLCLVLQDIAYIFCERNKISYSFTTPKEYKGNYLKKTET